MGRRTMGVSESDNDDDQLMVRYREGDGQAFETLFGRHQAGVYNFARGVLSGDAGGAEEVLQETFLAVARAAASYEPQGYFRTWLMRIARNACLNRLESRRVRRGVEGQSLDGLDAPATQAGPARLAESAEQVEALRRAIASLPRGQREAILLFAMEDLSYREIGRVLDVPVNTVKTLIHRARAALAGAMEEM